MKHLLHNDGLTAINEKTGKATLAFRGTSPSNLRDWRENVDYVTKDWKIHPMKTIYGKRIHEFYENASSIHEIEHLTGFSKGAFGAIALGDAVGIEAFASAFSAFFSLCFLAYAAAASLAVPYRPIYSPAYCT